MITDDGGMLQTSLLQQKLQGRERGLGYQLRRDAGGELREAIVGGR